jgi:hypothetical protein
LAANAQFAFGVKAGLSSSGVDVDNFKNTLTQLKDEDNITGYHGGIFLRAKRNNIFLQPEAYLTSTGGKIEVTDGANVTVQKMQFTRLDVPVMVGYSFLNILRIQAGPVASVLLNGEFNKDDIDQYMNKNDWGYQAGIGLDIGNITADLRYEDIKRKYENQTTSFDVRNRQVIFSVGFKVFGR